jgi:hypothetical protein
MLKHRASERPSKLQRGGSFIQEISDLRQSCSCVSFQRHRLAVLFSAVETLFET